MRFGPGDVRAADFRGCRHAHIEGYLLFNPDLTVRVLESARAAGCGVSLDLGSFEVVNAAGGGLADLLGDYVDVVFANGEEAAAFCGSDDPMDGLDALAGCCRTAGGETRRRRRHAPE